MAVIHDTKNNSNPPAVAVNVKVKYLRKGKPKGDKTNLRDWMQNPGNVYCGRKQIVFLPILNQTIVPGEKPKKARFPMRNSIWHNPYKGEGAIQKFEKYIRKKLDASASLRMELQKLRGKNLGCWCKPAPCHVDVIVKLIDEYGAE